MRIDYFGGGGIVSRAVCGGLPCETKGRMLNSILITAHLALR